MQKFRRIALSLARQAGDIMRHNFQLDMAKEWKTDNSPVTATDTAINQLVYDTIHSEFPEHAVISEELPPLQEGAEYAWVCDPVDGTLPFCHGLPISTFSLALTRNGQVLLGAIYDPQLNRMFYAEKGQGAKLNIRQIRVSDHKSLQRTVINAEGQSAELWDLSRLIHKAGGRATNLYSIVYSGGLVAAGQLAGLVLGVRNPWDAAAIKIVVEEAGGRVTDLDGNDQRYDIETNGLIASNGWVHDQLIDLVRQSR